MFQEDTLFALRPGNVIGKGLHLDILASGDRVEIVKESTDYEYRSDEYSTDVSYTY